MQQTRIPKPQGSGAWKTGWRGLGDGLSRQLWLLQSDALAAEARRRTGLEDFGDPPIEPALSILANSLGIREARTLTQGMESITAYREAHPELAGRFIDVKYDDLVSDPLAVVRRIYQQLDIRFTAVAAQRMQCLAAIRSRYKRPRFSSAFTDLELDGLAGRRLFEAYCSRFEVLCKQSELQGIGKKGRALVRIPDASPHDASRSL